MDSGTNVCIAKEKKDSGIPAVILQKPMQVQRQLGVVHDGAMLAAGGWRLAVATSRPLKEALGEDSGSGKDKKDSATRLTLEKEASQIQVTPPPPPPPPQPNPHQPQCTDGGQWRPHPLKCLSFGNSARPAPAQALTRSSPLLQV